MKDKGSAEANGEQNGGLTVPSGATTSKEMAARASPPRTTTTTPKKEGRRRSSVVKKERLYLLETGGCRGEVDPGYEPVRKAFAHLYAEGRETGSQCCCWLGGRPVVSLVGGVFSRPDEKKVKDFGATQPARHGTPLE